MWSVFSSLLGLKNTGLTQKGGAKKEGQAERCNSTIKVQNLHKLKVYERYNEIIMVFLFFDTRFGRRSDFLCCLLSPLLSAIAHNKPRLNSSCRTIDHAEQYLH